MKEAKFKIHSGCIELACAVLLDYRKNIIVPNVSHGFFGNHEADLVVVDSNNRLTEVEVKISIADLKQDFNKPKHQNPSRYVSRLVYAIPIELLEKSLPLIPDKYGIIVVHTNYYGTNPVPYFKAYWHRQVKHNKFIQPISERDIRNIIRLGCMRIWTLKRHNNMKKFNA